MQRRRSSLQANALIITLFLITLMTSFIGVAYNITSHTALSSHRSTEMNSAYAVADSALELLFARWHAAMKLSATNWTVTGLKTASGPDANPLKIDITQITLKDLGLPDDAPYQINAVKLTHVDIYGRAQDDGDEIDVKTPPASSSDPYYFSSSPVGGGFTGYNIIYEAKVWVTSTLHGSVDAAAGKTTGSPVTVGVKRYFTKGVSPTMQAAIFYENQLELHPGSNMTIKGLVHSNDNIFSCGYKPNAAIGYSGSIVDYQGIVSYVGYNNSDTSGTRYMTDADRSLSHITDESTQLNAPKYSSAPQQTSHMSVGGIDPDDLHADNDPTKATPNYNDDSYREVVERPVRKPTSNPGTANTTPYDDYYDSDPASIASQRLYNQASYKILLSKDPTTGKMTVQIRGATPAGMADGPIIPTTSGVGQAIAAAINLPTNISKSGERISLNDRRESANGGTDTMVNTIDMGVLKTALTGQADFNGVVYVSDTTTNTASSTGSYNDVRDVNFGNMTDIETDSSGTRIKHAVMLTNGAQLPTNSDGQFTIASDNAVYIKGDYNTGSISQNVPTNVAGGAAGDTYDKVLADGTTFTPATAAVIADAVGVVSNRFDPSKSDALIYDSYTVSDSSDPNYVNPLGKYQSKNANKPLYVAKGSALDGKPAITFQSKDPTAAYYVPPGDMFDNQPLDGELVRGAEPTTVNTAVVSGYTPTHGDVSSGGAENLIRLLENWSDADYDTLNFTYNGSLMQSFISKEFNGDWHVDSNYSNPDRQIRFDQRFLTKPPAATPSTVVFVRGTWERFQEPVPQS